MELEDHNSSWKRKNDVVVLGVAPWGCVDNRQALEKEEEEKEEKEKVEAIFCSEKKSFWDMHRNTKHK